MERLLLDAQTVQNFSFQESGGPSVRFAAWAAAPAVSIVSGVGRRDGVEVDSGGGGGGGGGWGVVVSVFTRRGSYAMIVEETMG